jgi:hypothetical protein
MKAKFIGLVASLVLFGSSQAQAATYLFDVNVGSIGSPGGTVDVAVSGSTATFVVSLPTNDLLYQFGLNLNPGASVNGGFNLSASGASYGSYGPFNTVLTIFPLNGTNLTFTVSGYNGISNFMVAGQPIWFVATFANQNHLGIFAADRVVTPLPATLPLFASGAGIIGLLGWCRKRKKAALRAAA